MIKKYNRNPWLVLIFSTLAIISVLLPNFSSATSEKTVETILILSIGFVTIYLFSVVFSYIKIDSGKITQRELVFSFKSIEIAKIHKISYDSKYNWFLTHNGYLTIFTNDDLQHSVMAINPRAYKPRVISELLSDLKKINPNIKFDKQTEQIQSGKVLP